MVSVVHASARVFRVRTEFVALSREVRVHVLCECGSGAWVAAIAPFPDLFFDARPLIGRTVGDAVAWLSARYAGLRILADILGSSGCRDASAPSPAPDEPPADMPARPPCRRARPPKGQDELPLAPPVSRPRRSPSLSPLFPGLAAESLASKSLASKSKSGRRTKTQ